MHSLLIVEDNVGLREQMKWAFCETYRVIEADSWESCVNVFEKETPTIICLDMGLDNVQDKGLELIDYILSKNRLAKIIVITANTSALLGTESIKRGAFDFLNKPVDIDQLQMIVDRATRLILLSSSESKQEQSSVFESSTGSFMVGNSKPMGRIFEFIKRLGTNDVNVLITGESGTGKELCARAIHHHSDRHTEPFVPINCGAIPENLIESELFGYMKGAFTGADADKIGLIESADKGTLFLDEVGDMPLNLQVKLLRFLEDHKLQRVGDTKIRSVDVRVIAATNKKLLQDVNGSGSLRSDLYYRLSEFEILIPPLREREQDVLLIANHILARNRKKFNQPALSISSRTEQIIQHYSWPGNIRELENRLSRASIISLNQIIEPEDLEISASEVIGLSLKDARDMFEKKYVINVLRQTNSNISESAKLAGVSRPTLYDMIKKHRIQIQIATQVITN